MFFNEQRCRRDANAAEITIVNRQRFTKDVRTPPRRLFSLVTCLRLHDESESFHSSCARLKILTINILKLVETLSV